MSGISGCLRISGWFSLVVVEQASEERPSSDRPNVFRWWAIRRRHAALPEQEIVERLVRSDRIVVRNERLHDVIEMPQPEAEEMVQAFTFERADPRLRVAVGHRRGDAWAYDLDAGDQEWGGSVFGASGRKADRWPARGGAAQDQRAGRKGRYQVVSRGGRDLRGRANLAGRRRKSARWATWWLIHSMTAATPWLEGSWVR